MAAAPAPEGPSIAPGSPLPLLEGPIPQGVLGGCPPAGNGRSGCPGRPGLSRLRLAPARGLGKLGDQWAESAALVGSEVPGRRAVCQGDWNHLNGLRCRPRGQKKPRLTPHGLQVGWPRPRCPQLSLAEGKRSACETSARSPHELCQALGSQGTPEVQPGQPEVGGASPGPVAVGGAAGCGAGPGWTGLRVRPAHQGGASAAVWQ